MTDAEHNDAPEGEVTLNKRQLAHAAGVSEPTIDKWLQDGCPVKTLGSNGRGYEFVLRDVLDWRKQVEEAARAEAERVQASMRQAELELTGGTVAPGEFAKLGARDRVAALDAEYRALRLAKEKGQLVDRNEVERDYNAVFALLRQRLMSMPTYLARVAQFDAAKTKIVEAEMRDLLRDLAKQIADPTLRPNVDKANAA